MLIVDDDAMLRRALADRLKFWGHETEEAGSGELALEMTRKRQYDLILLDFKLPAASGLEVLENLRGSGIDSDIVMLTAHGSVEAAVQAIRLGAADFLSKPADFDLLEAIVERLLIKRRMQRVNEALVEQRDQHAPLIVGASVAMQKLLSSAKRVAESNTTVMLRGESGVGKQVVAEYIHRHSSRSQGPFVYINCVALSDDLIESTLFGHEKGAFTGATARKPGRFEAANGGTAFLDEIGDITPRLQTKLLHFLETGEFEHVGGTRTIRVDCRILAATNRDLEAGVKSGEFREDLLYRLNVIELRVPELRERPEDIEALTAAYIDRYAKEMKRGTLRLAPRTATILRNYRWPGNVRQLKNAIERMVVMSCSETLGPDLLPPEILETEAAAQTPSNGKTLKAAVVDFKRTYISKTLARTGGNQTKAAELLGLQRTFLNRLIKELGAQAPDDASTD